MIEGEALPTLDAPRVRLRAADIRDVDALFSIFSDERMMRYWSSAPMKDRGEAEAYLARMQAGFAEKKLFQWGLERKADGVLVGTCTLFHVDATQRRAEIGYCLRSDFWKQGYMQEALGALIAFSFDVLALRRLEADVDPRNAASLRLLGLLGFREVGLLRERWNVGGEVQDSLFLGLLAREWRERGTVA
jgi:ribosomal-protein-alanine N-acetyltransferase